MDETRLIQLFQELTGDAESSARSVFMYLDMLERDYFPAQDASGTSTVEAGNAVESQAATTPSTLLTRPAP